MHLFKTTRENEDSLSSFALSYYLMIVPQLEIFKKKLCLIPIRGSNELWDSVLKLKISDVQA